MALDTEYDEWHRDAARDEYLRCCLPDVDILVERKPRSWTCSCGWSGKPDRTHNSGGVVNFIFCPDCKSHLHAPENVKEIDE